MNRSVIQMAVVPIDHLIGNGGVRFCNGLGRNRLREGTGTRKNKKEDV